MAITKPTKMGAQDPAEFEALTANRQDEKRHPPKNQLKDGHSHHPQWITDYPRQRAETGEREQNCSDGGLKKQMERMTKGSA